MKTWNDYKDHIKLVNPEFKTDIEEVENLAAIVGLQLNNAMHLESARGSLPPSVESPNPPWQELNPPNGKLCDSAFRCLQVRYITHFPVFLLFERAVLLFQNSLMLSLLIYLVNPLFHRKLPLFPGIRYIFNQTLRIQSHLFSHLDFLFPKPAFFLSFRP